jgi:drug/metabolite transporter (DMT)-like permease
MYTMSPVITLMLSLFLGVRRPSGLGVAGIGVGFIGALIVTLTRGEAGRPADILWVVIGLMIPVSLAFGNIYRTYDWPEEAGPIELAAGSHMAAAVLLLLGVAATGNAGSLALLPGIPLLVLAQVVSATTMFAFFFRLQAVGGPVYLSQVGYVAAAVALFSGVFFLGERYQFLTWIGAAITVVGVVMTTRAQMQQ